MNPIAIGLVSVGGLFTLLALGVPVGVALGGVGLFGLAITVGWTFALSIAQTLPYSFVASYTWSVLPLFILMGCLAAASGLSQDIFRAAQLLFGRIRGGMYLAVVFSSEFFAAVSGSTVVNAVVFTRLALPEMLRLGYSRSLSAGCICATGGIAALIPPSLTMVLIGIMTDQSIGKLFMAGIIPGVVTAVVYGLTITALVAFRPGLAPPPKPISAFPSRGKNRESLLRVLPAAALMALVLGGIYAGWFAPSSAGAIGAFGAFLLCVWRRSGFDWLPGVLSDAVGVTGSILVILIGGLFFSRFLLVSGVIPGITALAEGLTASPNGLMLMLIGIYLVLGCFLDTSSIIVVTLPIVFPLIQKAGIEPIWFSVIFAKLIEVAVFTPPIGVNLFATLSAAGEDSSLPELVRGLIPFLCAEAISLTILFVFPTLSTWLPDRMAG